MVYVSRKEHFNAAHRLFNPNWTDERNKEEMERVEKAMHEIFDYALALGGTITGEHGVGLAKKAFLPAAIGGASLALMKQLKHALDPQGILNPGKIFDLA